MLQKKNYKTLLKFSVSGDNECHQTEKTPRNLSQTKLHTLSKVLSKWTLPNIITLILHCLRHFSIAFKESVNFYREIMGFSHSLCQAFFTAIIPQEEGIILQQFCMTSLVFNNFQATCRIKVFKVFAFSHIWSGQYNKLHHWESSMQTRW